MLRILFVALIVFIFFPCQGYSVFEEKPVSTRALSMGGVYVGLADDISSIYLNPAGLARLEFPELGSTYTTLFGLPELKYSNLAYSQPLGRFGSLGLGWEGFGIPIYEERIASISYARKIFKGTYLGGSLKYMELSIETVGRGADFGLDLGLFHELGKCVNLGLVSHNLNRPRIGEDLPLRITAGLSVKPVEKIILALDYEIVETPPKESLSHLAVGIEFELIKVLFFRAGVQNEPKRVSFGLGLRRGWVKFDYAYLSHNVLDASHQVSLVIVFR